MNLNLTLLFILVLVTNNILAKPFIPEHDWQIIQRLPKPVFQNTSSSKIKQLRAKLKLHANNWSAASQLAQYYIELSQAQADPRYMGYAQAILSPWWQHPKPPLNALIMRAIIRQNAHDFKSANADLDQILNVQAGHVQANLIKATIASVQGHYKLAEHHCRQLMRRSSLMLAIICQSTPASLSGKAASTYKILHQLLSATTELPEKEKTWAWTNLAEIAWRLGYFTEAESHFKTALLSENKNYYLLKVYADFLLQQQRPLDVIDLLASESQNDSLLLRLAIANQMTHSQQLGKQLAILKARYSANRKRGSTLHKGDEARFKLHLLRQPKSALQLAILNWQVQREPADTYILLQSAIAANDSATIQQTTHWLALQGTEDILIQQILANHKATKTMGKSNEI